MKAYLSVTYVTDASPLVLAVMNGYEDLVELLLTSDCDVEMSLVNNKNILHLAVSAHQTEAINVLLSKSKRASNLIMIKDDIKKQSPWELAVEKNLLEIIMLFIIQRCKKHGMDE